MYRLATDERGGTLVYATLIMLMALGAGALALDIGRMTVLRTEMQNRADAGAMGGALFLDGSDGARGRAQSVAMNAMVETSGIPGDSNALNVQAVNFYSQFFPTKVAATTDLEAAYIEVVLTPRRVDHMMAPLADAFASKSVDASKDFEAVAVAGPDPFVCNAPPLMMCNLAELDPALDMNDPATWPGHVGKQIVLKEPQGGNATMVPGNFGLLALPDGSKGANDIEGALAAVEPQQCQSLDVTTAPGSKTNKVKSGINARFDLPGNSFPFPAPNVINYPRDEDVLADPQNTKLGNGNYALDGMTGYWQTKHGTVLPPDLADASRYQVYLYELGLEFARNGKQTLYPVPGDFDPALAQYSGYTLVTPPGPDIVVDPANPDMPEFDGAPSEAVASNGYARRLVKVAVLDCIADSVRGTGTFPTEGKFLEMFITEYVLDPPNAAIYGEFIRPITTLTSPDFHANVRLVQ